MTPKEQLEILQAYVDGKKIERMSVLVLKDDLWHEIPHDHLFDFVKFKYRIKPEEVVMYSFYYYNSKHHRWDEYSNYRQGDVDWNWNYYRNVMKYITTDIQKTTYKVLP